MHILTPTLYHPKKTSCNWLQLVFQTFLMGGNHNCNHQQLQWTGPAVRSFLVWSGPVAVFFQSMQLDLLTLEVEKIHKKRLQDVIDLQIHNHGQCQHSNSYL